jgi:hypothetical protein
MNLWIKRILGALPVLGCGAGITVIAVALGSTPMTGINLVIFTAFGLIYIAGAVAGMMLLEGHRYALTVNFFYWLLQTVHFYSVVWTFVLWMPFNLGGWWNFTTSQAGVTAQVGSSFRFTLFDGNAQAAVEVNALAVACCVYLFVCYRRERRQLSASSSEASPSAVV